MLCDADEKEGGDDGGGGGKITAVVPSGPLPPPLVDFLAGADPRRLTSTERQQLAWACIPGENLGAEDVALLILFFCDPDHPLMTPDQITTATSPEEIQDVIDLGFPRGQITAGLQLTPGHIAAVVGAPPSATGIERAAIFIMNSSPLLYNGVRTDMISKLGFWGEFLGHPALSSTDIVKVAVPAQVHSITPCLPVLLSVK